MSRIQTINAVSCLALACMSGVASAQGAKVGSRLPAFSLTTVDGTRLFSKDMHFAGHPGFIFFINDLDNTSRQAASQINRMVKAYNPGTVKWYGVINAKEDRVRAYQAEFTPPYQLLMDPQLTTINLLGVKSSPTVIMINPDGRIGKIWSGYSGKMLKDLNASMARAANRRAQRLDLGQAPSSTRFGQPYVRQTTGSTSGG